MIKVNLVRSRTATNIAAAGTQTEMGGGTPGGEPSVSEKRDAIVKIVLMMAFVIGLMIFESQQMDQLKLQQAQSQQRLVKIQNEVKVKKTEIESLAHLETEAKELEERLKVLKRLSKDRLRLVKALDYIQNITPERVWLTNLKYDKGKMAILGMSVTDDDMSEFVRSLENSIYFSDVILTQAKEAKSDKGTFKSFEVNCLVGLKD